jgi:hypothetical protein
LETTTVPTDERAPDNAQETLFDIRDFAKPDTPAPDAPAAAKTVTVTVRQTTYQRRPPSPRKKRADTRTIEERLRDGRDRRDDAVQRVGAHVADDWLDYMLAVVERLARERADFASFDVTDAYDRDDSPTKPAPAHDNRAIGHVMKTAQARGLIAPTETFVPTPVKEHHAAPKRVWRSLIFRRDEQR